MRKRLMIATAVLSVSCMPAYGDGDYHPMLDSSFQVGLGAFFPTKNFKLSVDGTGPGAVIDFEESFDVDNTETTGALDFRWRFGEKWSVQGQYWTVGDSGEAVLDKDVHWEDVVIEQGTNAGASIDLDVARVFFGRRFSQGPQHEFGLGLGLHWLRISAGVQGQVLTNLGDSEFYRGSVSADAPLPNIGAWYTWSWSPRWALTSRVDWLSASIGDYSGGLWDASVGVNWAFSDHFGIGAAWNLFKLNVDVDKSDWRGKVSVSQNGPFVSLTATW